jgi:hypothetical protein
MKMLLGDMNATVGIEDMGMRGNFATSKNMVVMSTTFPHCNIHKYICTSPDGKTHNHIDHVLID